MTYPDVVADDRWALPMWTPLGRSWRLSDCVAGPLERALLTAVAVLTSVLLWSVLTAEDATGMTMQEDCVLTAVEDARAFARVLGDGRFIPVSFAVQACEPS